MSGILLYNEPFLDGRGRISKNWYDYLSARIAESDLASLQAQIDELRAEIEGGSSDDLSITGSFSVQVLGNAEGGFFIQLRNDTQTPDPDSYYGTDSGGTRGYHAIPSDTVPYFIPADETYTVPLYRQALFSMPIEVTGSLVVDGFLVEVA